MGPLVPDIIGNELNLVVALLIGIAFGFILEQAGFSTSRKLVGLFYGYDFTVLRVFFTAGITAMLGVIAFGHFGILDLNLIYINPTYIWSALAGGLFMGMGFVIGGFCPGTSVCAAATGKIDAMIFIAGSFLGVLIFAEGYPWFEGLYKAGFWGFPHIFETIGISQASFAVVMTIMAVGAFAAAALVEKRVIGTPVTSGMPARIYYGLGIGAILISLTSFAMPERQSGILEKSEDAKIISSFAPKSMTIDEFAFRIMDEESSLHIVDLRSPEHTKGKSLPNSVNMTLAGMFGKDAAKFFARRNATYVIVDEDESAEKKAAYIADELGFENVFILSEGMKGFEEKILNFRMPEGNLSRADSDTYRFREKARNVIPELIKNNSKKTSPEKKESKRALGGC
ncbi:MAG: YeeE/YedE family protein [Ignavibacteria bacterium]|nr:YeeE/YedE family protein [Ignavibacteria bacterium]